MCGGGDLGGSNNKDNDDKKGSGNSFGESLANAITPNDGFSYRDGVLPRIEAEILIHLYLQTLMKNGTEIFLCAIKTIRGRSLYRKAKLKHITMV